MKITKITVSFEGTINLGNYQNIKVGATAEVEVSEGETPAAVIGSVFNDLRESLRAEVDLIDTQTTASWLRATALKSGNELDSADLAV
jgi:hypothetical protein